VSSGGFYLLMLERWKGLIRSLKMIKFLNDAMDEE